MTAARDITSTSDEGDSREIRLMATKLGRSASQNDAQGRNWLGSRQASSVTNCFKLI